MNVSFEIVSIAVSIIAGIISLALTIFMNNKYQKSEQKKLQVIEERQLDAVLNSDNLIDIGIYLDKVIGNFTTYEYVSNTNISKKVDDYISKIEAFVGTEVKTKQEIETLKPETEVKKIPVLDDFIKVIDEINSGEIWNGLARLRRFIEKTLRDIAEKKGVAIDRPLSAGQLLHMLSSKEVISEDIFEEFRYAITIANRAIHGEDISLEEARQAVSYAAMGFSKLD